MTTSYWMRRNGQEELRENLRAAVKERGWTLTRAAKEADVKYGRMTAALAAQRWFLREEVEAFAEVLEATSIELMGKSVFKDDPGVEAFDKPTSDVTARR